MSSIPELTPSTIERIRSDLVGLKMPRALEAVEQIVRRRPLLQRPGLDEVR
jgi:hypothetical protein